MIERDKNLILIPDYMSVTGLKGQPSDAILLGDPAKAPGELRTDRFLDVNDDAVRRMVMGLVPRIARVSVMTPSLAFYRRVYDLRDDCFFADLFNRLVSGGAYASIVSGMQREKVPRRAMEWLQAISEDGVKILYAASEAAAPGAPDLVTADYVAACKRQGRTEIVTAPGAIVTPNAYDEAKEKGITIIKGRGGTL